jgi:hypothetical protein
MADQPSDFLKHVWSWAGQTIVFALGARANNTGKRIAPDQQAVDGKRIANVIWQEVAAGTKAGTPETYAAMEYAHRVIDWCSDYLSGTASERDDRIRHIRNWGRQTIGSAASIRSEEVGKPIDEQKRALAAGNEFTRLGIDLWEETLTEVGPDAEVSVKVAKFNRNVLRWTVKHLEGCKV